MSRREQGSSNFSKSRQNGSDFSKNPPSVGSGRNVSSHNQLSGGQKRRLEMQMIHFPNAVVACVTNFLKGQRIELSKEEIERFAYEYAVQHPPVGDEAARKLFLQNEVDAALAAFQESFQLTQQAEAAPNTEKLQHALKIRIISRIMQSARECGVNVRPEDAAAFACEYASGYIASNPAQRFTDDDVQHALEIFQEGYNPAEQLEQQAQCQGEQQTQGEHEDLVDEEAAILAERTRQQQEVEQRNDSLRKQVAQQKRDEEARHRRKYARFYDVLENGASRENLGEEIFSNLEAQRLPDGMIFAFHSSPSIGHFQLCMCKRQKSGNAICGFARGWNFSEDGTIIGFRQSLEHEPRFMIGKPVLVFPGLLGYFIFKHEVTDAEDKTKGGDHFSDAFYAGVGGEYSGDPAHNAACIGDALKQAIRGIIPKRNDEIKSSLIIRQQILASPEFQARYTEAMRALGGIPVRLHEDVQQQDASDATSSFSEVKDESTNPWGAAAFH
jgi:hypothetical protein